MAAINMCDRGRFQNSNFLATLHQKNTEIVVRIYATEYVQRLSSFGFNLVKIFKVVERWVLVDVWVGDSSSIRFLVLIAKYVILNNNVRELNVQNLEPFYAFEGTLEIKTTVQESLQQGCKLIFHLGYNP